MKKAIRILVPVLLVCAILASAAWYFLVYDREFTRDLLLRYARSFEASGNHKMAATLYDITYKYSSDNEDIAIELAQQFKESGNYTKAEYTLSHAIADGGGSKLYIALCQTYVEQDKLLDAVNMLDNIADPAIREELEAMRPPVPTVDKQPGFYNQYISVTLTAPDGTLYMTTDGSYPSTALPTLVDSGATVTLDKGETTLCALAVSENGLVSRLGVYGYTVGGVIEVVQFQDPAFEQAVRQILGAEPDTVLYSDALWSITDFVIPQDAENYTDLGLLPYLQTLRANGASAEQLANLSGLANLESLYLSQCNPGEGVLKTIAAMPKLKKLTLTDCTLSSVAPLSSAVNLEYLNLNGNAIRNLDFLIPMAKLQQLHLSHNALTDLSALHSLTALQVLDVSYNSLTSLDPISSLSSLTELYVGNNQLTTLGNIQNLTALTDFTASYNNLTDVSGLSACTQIINLDISNNAITDITALSTLSRMEQFDFSYNEASTLPEFSKDCALVQIDGSHNTIVSLDPLAELPCLNNVLMDYNPELASVAPLVNCPVLLLVNVYGTKVTDVSFLTDQSIVVNFDPTLGQ